MTLLDIIGGLCIIMLFLSAILLLDVIVEIFNQYWGE